MLLYRNTVQQMGGYVNVYLSGAEKRMDIWDNYEGENRWGIGDNTLQVFWLAYPYSCWKTGGQRLIYGEIRCIVLA